MKVLGRFNIFSFDLKSLIFPSQKILKFKVFPFPSINISKNSHVVVVLALWSNQRTENFDTALINLPRIYLSSLSQD